MLLTLDLDMLSFQTRTNILRTSQVLVHKEFIAGQDVARGSVHCGQVLIRTCFHSGRTVFRAFFTDADYGRLAFGHVRFGQLRSE